MNSFMSIVKKNYRAFAVFAVLVFVFYGNAVSNGFILDDHSIIENNPYIQSLRYLPKVVTGCIWENAFGGCRATLYYRPITTLSLLLTYQISSKSWIFHLVNLFYLFLAGSLVFVLGKVATGKHLFAFFAALIFLAHPANNEMGNWISVISELISVIFALLALIYYFFYQKRGLARDLFFVCLFYLFGLLAGEAVIILPLIFAAVDLLFFKVSIQKFLKWEQIKKYIFLSVSLAVYFVMRFLVIGPFGGKTITGQEYFGNYAISERIYAFFKLFALYLGKFFYPFPLMLLRQIEIKTSLLNPGFFGYLFIFFSFVGAICLLIKKKQKLPAFCLIWFFVFLFPSLLFFWVGGGNVYAERYLFMPGIGLSLLIAFFLNSLWEKKEGFLGLFAKLGVSLPEQKRKKIILAAISAFVIFSWIAVFPKNKNWKDDITLFRANLAYDNNTAFFHSFLGDELFNRRDYEGAKREYEEIIINNPDYHEIDRIYSNLGDCYMIKRDFSRAEEYYLKAVEASRGRNYESYYRLGTISADRGDYLRALLNFCKVMQINPAPDIQESFDRTISMINATEKEKLIFLYEDITTGGAFRESEGEKIIFKKRSCLSDRCSYAFFPAIGEGEMLFPFLIMAKISGEEAIKIEKPSFDPTINEIALDIDAKYKDKISAFIFPSCDGVYYEVTVPIVGN